MVDAYSDKELISARAHYSKMYEFMPWQFTEEKFLFPVLIASVAQTKRIDRFDVVKWMNLN